MSDRPPVPEPPEGMRALRDEFVQTFFRKGAALTEELIAENARLAQRTAELEDENARLRTQLASDSAMRDLLAQIEKLEKDKQALLSRQTEAEQVTRRFVARFHGLEEELSTLASLYVASFQLGASLRREAARRHIGELLTQLVGARAYGVFLLDERARRLQCVAHEGLGDVERASVAVGDAATAGSPWALSLERAVLTGAQEIADDPRDRKDGAPVAAVPLKLDDRTVGVVAVAEVLPQKAAFAAVDLELFKLLTAHAAAAVYAAELYETSGRALPSPTPTDPGRAG